MKYLFNKTYLLISVFTITELVSPVVCMAQDIAGSDKYIYRPDSITIGPDFFDPEVCYYWEPKELLDDNSLINPIARITETTSFKLTATGKDFSYSKEGSMMVHFIKVEEIAGTESYVCQGSKIELTAKLTDNIPLPEGWHIEWSGSDDIEFLNQENVSATVIFDAPNANAKIEAWITGSKDTAVLSTLVVGLITLVVGFAIKQPNTGQGTCDGYPVPLYISPLPEGISESYLECFSDFVLSAEPSYPSFGNPAGTTTLTFTPVDENRRCEVEIAYWYSETSDYCNESCLYRIWGTAHNSNGDLVKTKTPLEIKIWLNSDCVNGGAVCCANYFNNIPDIALTEITPGGWTVVASQGFLVKHIVSNEIVMNTHPNSQFYNQVLDEEEYHRKQQEGLILTDYFDKTFLVDSIIDHMNWIKLKASTAAEAYSMAMDNFINCRNQEINRSGILLKSKFCRCRDEMDAKSNFTDLFGLSFSCAYPDCLNDNPDWSNP